MIKLKGLQKAIDAKGETQTKLADKMGVATELMHIWATQECESIPAERILQMSNALDVSIDFIYTGKEFGE